MNFSQDTSSILKTSFRQKGASSQGKLVKGFIQDATLKTNISSIPSKFETIIYTKPSKKAFGTSSNRFYSTKLENIKDLPGPGYYNFGFNANDSNESEKVGNSGFLSKTNRNPFSMKYPNSGPGPGSYDAKNTSFASNFTHSTGITKESTFSLKKDDLDKKKDTSKPKIILPGPGEYNPKNSILSKENRTYLSSFVSQVARDEYIGLKASPDPGQYEIRREILKKESFKHNGPSPSFVYPEKNKMKPKHTTRELLDLFANNKLSNRFEIPGPGFYTTGKDISVAHIANQTEKQLGNDGKEAEIPNSWIFKTGLKNRFGDFYDKDFEKNLGKEMPGPGAYVVKNGSTGTEERREVSGAVFMSESVREPFGNLKGKLGPNTLVPFLIPRNRTYHLNLERKWV